VELGPPLFLEVLFVEAGAIIDLARIQVVIVLDVLVLGVLVKTIADLDVLVLEEGIW